MAVVQDTYSAGRPIGYAGMVANGETSNRISRTVEDAAAIAFGRPVFQGTGAHGVTATPSAALLGIAIGNYAPPAVQATGVQADSYPQYSTAGILTQGVIWVQVAAAVAARAQAYVTAAGVITATATGNTILTGWFFDDAASGAGLVRLAKR